MNKPREYVRKFSVLQRVKHRKYGPGMVTKYMKHGAEKALHVRVFFDTGQVKFIAPSKLHKDPIVRTDYVIIPLSAIDNGYVIINEGSFPIINKSIINKL